MCEYKSYIPYLVAEDDTNSVDIAGRWYTMYILYLKAECLEAVNLVPLPLPLPLPGF